MRRGDKGDVGGGVCGAGESVEPCRFPLVVFYGAYACTWRGCDGAAGLSTALCVSEGGWGCWVFAVSTDDGG